MPLHFILGSALVLMWFVCHVIVLFHAFKTGLVEGLLYLCIPCYALYYVLFRFEHPSKTLIVLCYLFGGTVGGSLCGWTIRTPGWGWGWGGPAHHR
jgi:hypothetical protein